MSAVQMALQALIAGRDLGRDEMTTVMHQIMGGEATPAQIGGFLVALRMKGETVEEITAAAEVMRALATPVDVDKAFLVDTCGTGGDGARTFNISTTSAFVAAAAGARVAKHGNRSVSSASGSADVLEAAGVHLALTPGQVGRCIDEVGIGFMFAPQHHGAMKHAIGPRREMGVRTIFNVLGPLTNPAGAPAQVIGVFDDAWRRPLAEVLERLGSRQAMVVHADDGMDEISVCAPTRVSELKDGRIEDYTIEPEAFGLACYADASAIKAETVAESLALMKGVLKGEIKGAARDIVLLNAGAAIYVSGRAGSLAEGVDKAVAAIDSGEAAA
ncbi:MAG: anthranilate phosphoribosyltransferase, partial [Gammaproteobacteria bacterium]|nr:anthranilate phosphoribosyltransferase [Gammaproteobacteria bacterium]